MILKKVKDSLNELAALVPKDQTEVFKKHFSDVLEIVFETGCSGHCLFIDNKDFKSKAASTPEFITSLPPLIPKARNVNTLPGDPPVVKN